VLSIPKDKGYDNGYLELCNIRQKLITQIYSEDSSPIDPFKEEDVSKAVKQLNAGKAADEYGIVAEHLKMAGGVIIPYATADSNIEQPYVKPNCNVDCLKLCDNFGSKTYSKSFVMTGANSDPPVFVHLSCVF
jgi:hypothetical protein